MGKGGKYENKIKGRGEKKEKKTRKNVYDHDYELKEGGEKMKMMTMMMKTQ